jgi:hypothetical protein
MRALLFTSLFLFAACSSEPSTPERADKASPEEQKAAAHTDECLDNPELAKSWGDCNVKSILYQASSKLEKCGKGAGTVNFELRVKADGTVKSAKALGQKGKHVSCLGHVLQGLKFARPGNDVKITVPLE